MRDCPQCFTPVDGLVCFRCGYRDPAAPVAPVSQADPENWRCCDHDLQGNRCARRGSLSPSTRSTTGEGPWYCPDHFPPFRAMMAAARNRGNPDFVAMRAAIKAKPGPKRIDYRSIVERQPGEDDA